MTSADKILEGHILDGTHELPPGKIAAVVTYLEMREPPQQLAPLEQLATRDNPFMIRHVANPDPDWYRALFRSVGEKWLWFSRLSMSNECLLGILHDENVEIHVLINDGVEIGLLELDFRIENQCELSFFGLIEQAIGTGAGRFLMQAACKKAWAEGRGISCFHVHTCTLDHPSALGFYQRSGFIATRRAVEIANDPRCDGRLLPTSAAWFPVI
jgi:GNAT superfamily N-acetyltransferase